MRVRGWLAAIVVAALGTAWFLRKAGQRAPQAVETLGKPTETRESPAVETHGIKQPVAVETEKESPLVSDTPSARARRERQALRLLRWRMPPLWAVLLMLAVVLAFLGFARLPPDVSSIAPPQYNSEIRIWVDRPDVHLVALLDASYAIYFEYHRVTLRLYADSGSGGFQWLMNADGDIDIGNSSTPGVATGRVSSYRASYAYLQDQVDDLRTLAGGCDGNERDPCVDMELGSEAVAVAGSRLRVALPELTFTQSPPQVGPDGRPPNRRWYPPSGEVVVLAPKEVAKYRTDIASPGFSSTGVWRAPRSLLSYWSGTDPSQEAREQRDLFIGGLLFGIAGSALIAVAQDITARFRERRKRRAHKAAAQS